MTLFDATPGWTLAEIGLDTSTEPSAGSRLTVGNGLIALRGAPDAARPPGWTSWITTFRPVSWPRCYLAGLFDRPDIDPPVPLLMPIADFLHPRLRLNGIPLRLEPASAAAYRRTLDMRRGVLLTDWHAPGLRLQTLRLAARHDPSLALHIVQITPDAACELELDASLDLAGVGLAAETLSPALSAWRSERGQRVALATAAALDPPALAEPTPLGWRWRWRGTPGIPARFHRLVAIARTDDGENPAPAAQARLTAAHATGLPALLAAHEAALAERWAAAEITVTGDDHAQHALRFATHHLIAAANPADPRVSIGARALTGDGYLGHVFWDTEIHLLPFYTLTWPEAARALLLYRWHTLPQARANAAAQGYRGTMFAWESADTGEEATPAHILSADGRAMPVTTGRQEHHITADIAYAAWQYWEVTADADFLHGPGIDLLAEAARFWHSRAAPDPDGSRHIRGVIGPDEYHDSIDDNAFTNHLARHALTAAARACAVLRSTAPAAWTAAQSRLALSPAEPATWAEAAAAIAPCQDPATGIFEQFSGFFRRYAIDPGLSSPDARTWIGRQHEAPTRVIKQADVVALLALLPDAIPKAAQAANYALYEPLCTHESSLSSAQHAVAAARLGLAEAALAHFRDAAARDLSRDPEAAKWGVHIASLGGQWQAAVLGFGGVSWHGDELRIDPHLPPGWTSLAFALTWRGSRLRVVVTGAAVAVTLERGPPVALRVRGVPQRATK
jgi:trehalose/maltose hydrolase-like predicted phosphorylase